MELKEIEQKLASLATYSVEPIEEDILPKDAGIEDASELAEIVRLAEWNPWAWCCVKVTASWRGFEGQAYLGCGSYQNEKDFETSGYCDDLKAEALRDLARDVYVAQASLATLTNYDRKELDAN